MKKKSFIALLAAVVLPFTANAQQSEDMGYFKHLSASYSLGTDGLIGFEVASPIGNYVTARMGYSFMPAIKADADINFTYNGSQKKAKMQGKLNMGDFKLLFDVHPFRKSSFKVVAGFYVGRGTLVDVYTREPLDINSADYGGKGRVQIGTNPKNMFGTDPDGNIKGRARVNSFKPYVGIGFGRAIPKSLVNVSFDFGVQFWGTPKVELFSYAPEGSVLYQSEWKELKKEDFDETPAKARDKDGYDALKVVEKLTVYPVLNLRVNFRCF